MRSALLLPALGLVTLGLSALGQAQTNLGLNMLLGDSSTTTIGAGSTYNGWTNAGAATIEFVPSTVWDVHEGNGAVDLNGTVGPGAIAQTFATTAGQSYRIDFWYSGNPGPNGNTAGTKSFNVNWNGGTAGSFTFVHLPTDRWNNMRWLAGSVEVTAIGTSSVLAFQGTNTNHPDAGAAIDDVTITALPVPEPTSMVALGLGGLALLRRRKRA